MITHHAVVIDNKDPDKRGRIKVRIPLIMPTGHDQWCVYSNVQIINKGGIFFIPAIGDDVWVWFENNDPRFPVWEHKYAGGDRGIPIDLSVLYDESGSPNKGLILYGDSKISVSGDEVNLTFKDTVVSIKDNKVSVAGTTEPAVLGNQLSNLLTKLIQLTATNTYSGFGAPGSNSAQITQLLTELNKILSNKVTVG